MGIPVVDGGADGGQITGPGQLQYGDMLLGGGTSAGWRELVGWRDTPEGSPSDATRPQAHGAYPGDVWGSSLVVTYTYLLRGRPDEKLAYLDTIERHTRMDGVERCLAVNDGGGTWCRQARVIGRTVPMDMAYRHGPLECSVQFLCADPRRYGLLSRTGTVMLPTSLGGLDYPLVYALEYGTASAGGLTARNDGSEATPLVVEFIGPLDTPILIASEWRMGFNITLVDGERLTVDTGAGTALLNGSADRLYTIRHDSDPLERCLLRPGATNLSLTAVSGAGHLQVTYRDARM